jgi:hypothetical protein
MLTCLNCDVPTKRTPQSLGKFCSTICHGQWKIKQTDLRVEAGTCREPFRIKRYLIGKYGNRCMDADCAWDFEKRHVQVELEHIDGNSDNNQLGNLKLLCPGCHSLTSTYKAKNKGNGRASRRKVPN